MFIDFSIYIDAPEFLLKEWYIRRFLKFCNISCTKKLLFFQYAQLSNNKLISTALSTWNQINILNLTKYITYKKCSFNFTQKNKSHNKIHCIKNIKNSINTS